MPTYEDIDIYGGQNVDGSPLVYYAADAIKNAFAMWISAKRGEFLMQPARGGALDNFVFKTMNLDNISMLKFSLFDDIKSQFNTLINLKNLSIVPDYENRFTEIKITYSIPSEGIIEKSSIFINSNYSYNTFEYEEVSYIEENLKEFFTIKKPDMTNSRLLYDNEGGFWKWGKYKLTNLTPSDPCFTDILIIANGS
jgi:hypothetical protein